MFFYLGNQRLTLWLDSPNDAGTFLALVLLLALAFGRWPETGGRPWRLGRWAIVVLLAVGTGSVALCFWRTYSRGAAVSLGATLLFTGILRLASVRKLWLFVLVLASASLITPNADSRIGSMGDIREASVANRLTVWRSTLNLVRDHELTGLFPRRYYDVYNVWYKPPPLAPMYPAPMNNYLMVASAAGVPVFCAYVFTQLYVIIGSLPGLRATAVAPGVPLFLCTAQVVLVVSGLFTCSLASLTLVAAQAALLGACVVRQHRRLGFRPVFGPTVRRSALGALGSGVVMLSAARLAASPVSCAIAATHAGEVVLIDNRAEGARPAILVYCTPNARCSPGEAAALVRPLSALFKHAVVVPAHTPPAAIDRYVRAHLLPSSPRKMPVLLASDGEGALTVIAFLRGAGPDIDVRGCVLNALVMPEHLLEVQAGSRLRTAPDGPAARFVVTNTDPAILARAQRNQDVWSQIAPDLTVLSRAGMGDAFAHAVASGMFAPRTIEPMELAP